jgi:hypothetical protein
MAKTKEINLRGLEITLQNPSPQWYLECVSRNKDANGNTELNDYCDELFKNCVVAPAELRQDGMRFFDRREDLKGALDLRKEIERFLFEPKQYGTDEGQGTGAKT